MRPGTSISPELALVDPELRAAALAALPEPPDCLAVAPRAQPVSPPVAAESRWRRLSRRTATGAVWATLLLIPASSLLAFLPASGSAGPSFALPEAPSAEPSRPPARPAARPAPETSADPAPPAATAPDSAPEEMVLTWRAVQGARVYNVIFVRGSERIDTWTRTNRLALGGGATAPVGAAYTWFAYPGAIEAGRVAYGKVAGHGTVRVAAADIPRGAPPTTR